MVARPYSLAAAARARTLTQEGTQELVEPHVAAKGSPRHPCLQPPPSVRVLQGLLCRELSATFSSFLCPHYSIRV